MSIIDILNDIRKSDVTKTVHLTPYDAISVTRPELTQAGRTILITGGGTGVGFAIARAFVGASANTVIIVGRRAEVLETAQAKLEAEAKAEGTDTKIITRQCDITKDTDVDALWQYFTDKGIVVDVYVSNAAATSEVVGMMQLGTEKVWAMFEANVKGPMYLAEKFVKQPGAGEKQKFILNVTTGNIHGTHHPLVAGVPSYTLSKFSGTLFFQYLAQEMPHDKVQVVTFHPGLIFNETWQSMGMDKQHFDDDRLPGSFAVWAASKEAAFLHGRTVWGSWDVEELASGELRERLDKDFYFLRGTIAGLNGANLA